MSRRSIITMVVVVVLCAAWFAYSFDLLDSPGTRSETQSNSFSADQTSDPEKTTADAAQVTQKPSEPIDIATE